MPKRTPWEDEYTLLCERCGYVLEGLGQSGNCPECGRPIVERLPEHRIGTPWQRSPGVKSLVATWWMTLRHPLKTLDVMRFDNPKHASLLHISLFTFAGVCWLVVSTQSAFAGIPTIGIASALFKVIVLAVVACFFPLGLLFLTAIEAAGLQFFSRTKGTRISPTIAWTIVAHGAAGWGLSFLIWLSALQIQKLDTMLHPPQTDWERRHQILRQLDQIALPGFLIGLAAGLLVFETFAYLGLRRCKYANRVQPETHGRA